MDSLKDTIKSSDWQISTEGIGLIAQGYRDVNQCILTIVNTQKGTSPLRPDFGIDILNYQDKPGQEAAPLMVAEMLAQIPLYEPRIDITKINYQVNDAQVVFALGWNFKPGYQNNTNVQTQPYETLLLLSDENGFILLSDDNYALILN